MPNWYPPWEAKDKTYRWAKVSAVNRKLDRTRSWTGCDFSGEVNWLPQCGGVNRRSDRCASAGQFRNRKRAYIRGCKLSSTESTYWFYLTIICACTKPGDRDAVLGYQWRVYDTFTITCGSTIEHFRVGIAISVPGDGRRAGCSCRNSRLFCSSAQPFFCRSCTIPYRVCRSHRRGGAWS